MTRQQLFTEALALDPADREALAEELLLSAGEVDRAEIDAAWLTEARRRDDAIARGEASASTLDEVIAKARSGTER